MPFTLTCGTRDICPSLLPAAKTNVTPVLSKFIVFGILLSEVMPLGKPNCVRSNWVFPSLPFSASALKPIPTIPSNFGVIYATTPFPISPIIKPLVASYFHSISSILKSFGIISLKAAGDALIHSEIFTFPPLRSNASSKDSPIY